MLKNIDKNYFSLFNRFPVCFTHGEGARLFDSEGKEYLDFFSGIAVNSLGYNYPPLVRGISEQAKKLIHISNLYYNEPQARAAEALLKNTPFEKVFFCNSGLEANEAAIKLTRKHFYKKGKKRYKVVSFIDSFHGRSLATLAATGQEKFHTPFQPIPEGFIHTPFNDFTSIEKLLKNDNEIAAVLFEVVQGESGVRLIDKGFIKKVFALCENLGVLTIVDEIQTGVGRTGKFFGFEHFGVTPDIITLAKGLGGGVPVGALLGAKSVADDFSIGDHGTTFGGNPLSMAAAEVVVNTIKKDAFLSGVEKVGNYLEKRLKELNLPIRGLGLLWAIEVKENNIELSKKLLEKGLVVGVAGGNTLRLAPPLIVNEGDVDILIARLKETV